MKFSEAIKIANHKQYTLRRSLDGEYRACPKGGTEAQAYYTSDLEDAVGTIVATTMPKPTVVFDLPARVLSFFNAADDDELEHLVPVSTAEAAYGPKVLS
jgi:hypothetical protein